MDALFAAVVERFGRLDLLFNNAADTMPYTAHRGCRVRDCTGSWTRSPPVPSSCSRAAFRIMKAQTPRGGTDHQQRIAPAQVPRPDSIAFTAAKHAVAGLTRSLSLDGRRHDISCGQIDIGNVTPTTARSRPSARPTVRCGSSRPWTSGTLWTWSGPWPAYRSG